MSVRLRTVLKVFSHIHLLKGHMVCHTGTKSFFCPNCDNTFSYIHNLRRHQEKCVKSKDGKSRHSCENLFKCDKIACGKSFSDKRSLVRHEKAVHGKVRFICTKCKAAFSYLSGLCRHSKTCL